MADVYRGLVGAAHRAVRAVLGADATVTVDGTAYAVRVVRWEPPRTAAIGPDGEAIDSRPAATLLHADIDDSPVTPHSDTIAVGGRTYAIEDAKADGLGRLRLTLSGG